MGTLPAQVRWILWFALIAGVVTCFVTLQMMGSEGTGGGGLKNPLYVVGLLSAIASIGVQHFVKSRSAKGGQVVAFAAPAFIVALALAEAPAIFGLVLGFQGGSISDYLPLFAVSLVTFLMTAPQVFFPE